MDCNKTPNFNSTIMVIGYTLYINSIMKTFITALPQDETNRCLKLFFVLAFIMINRIAIGKFPPLTLR